MPRNITVYISDEIDDRMKKVPEVNWSEVCRQGIVNYLEKRLETTEALYKTLETLLEKVKNLEFEVQFIKRTVVGESTPPSEE